MVLALGLQRAGHEVLVLSSANFKGWAEGLGLPFVAFAPDLEDHSRKREAWNELVRAKVRLILRAFDEDRDGHISLREASALTTALGRDAFPEDVWQDLCRRGRCSPAAGPDARGLWLLLKDEPGELEAQYGAARRALRLRDQEEELPLGELTSDTVDPFCLSAMDVRAFAEALQRFGPEVLVGTGPGWELVAPLAERKFGIPYLTMRYQPVMGWPFGNEDLFQPVMRTWYAHLCSLEDTLVKPEHEITPLSDMTFAGFYDRYQGGGLFIPFLAALSDWERLSGAVLSSSTLPVRHELEAQVTRNNFTGFLFMEEEGDGKGWSSSEPAAELQAFLSRGPTACIGWGSMVSERGPHHMVRLAVAALKEAKMQGVILGGWAGLGAEALRQAGGSSDTEGLCSYAEQRVRFIEAAPHGWLFPRCSCVVHHGGLGTIAASLRAGVPMVITPIAVEQPANAALMSSLGWCIALEQLDEVTPSELAGALKSASTDEGLLGRAKSAQALVLEEDGTKEAVCSVIRFIENARERRGVGGAGVSRRAWPLRSAAAVAAASFAFAVARVHKYFRGHRDL